MGKKARYDALDCVKRKGIKATTEIPPKISLSRQEFVVKKSPIAMAIIKTR